RNAKLLKEDVRHIYVVMLPGVHQQLPDWAVFLQLAKQRSGFHEIGTRPNYVQNKHGSPTHFIYSSRSSTERRVRGGEEQWCCSMDAPPALSTKTIWVADAARAVAR